MPLSWIFIGDAVDPPEPTWIIGGLIAERTVVGMIGEPFAGKSWAAGHLALSVSSGRAPWGRSVSPGLAVYVAGERAAVTRRRLRAAAAALGVVDPPLAVLSGSPNLGDQREVREFIQLVREISAARPEDPLRLIVLDTLARGMTGLDENSARDVSLVARGLDEIVAATGGAILVLHHTGKTSRDARGSSAIAGAMDSILFVSTSRSGERTITLRETNDGEAGARVTFSIVDGALSETNVAAPAARANTAPRLAPDAQRSLTALVEIGGEQVPMEVWRRAAYGAFGKRTPAALRRALFDARRSLEAAGLIYVANDTVSVRKREDGVRSHALRSSVGREEA